MCLTVICNISWSLAVIGLLHADTQPVQSATHNVMKKWQLGGGEVSGQLIPQGPVEPWLEAKFWCSPCL